LESWLIDLKGQKKSPQTLRVYRTSVEAYLKSCGSEAELSKQLVARFLAEMVDNDAESATIRVRLTAIKLFAKWLDREVGFDEADRIAAISPPKLVQKPVPSLSENEIRAMIKTAGGTSFRDRRDKAILTLMTETGMRAGETLGMQAGDVSVADCIAVVIRGKGGHSRRVKFSASCAAILDRYMRHRRSLGWDSGPLWIGRQGPLSYKGLVRSLATRAEEAGVVNFHMHRLRHTMAVRWMTSGGSETGLMAQAGWKSREMIDRYVKTSAEDLAGEEFDRLSLGLD
jgi:site-specific recombinase XerD